mmetsp:Transcript_43884/g.72488  ORF Transcript_43884/g.72488 Transcript_43884/m.72488 type:complete len:347 (-) Transcript_43884:312-1352(-)
MSLITHCSNWQIHLLHLVVTLLVTLWFQPSFEIENSAKELFYACVWVTSFSLCSLKVFIILHDCGHHSFFVDGTNNEIFGRICSVFVCTPFYFWQKAHNKHHAIQGCSEKLDLSATIHFTVANVRDMRNKWLQALYLVFRIPVIFYLATPFLIWFVWFPYICVLQRDPLPLLGYLVRPLLIYAFAPAERTFYFCMQLNMIVSYIPEFLGVVLFHIQHSHNPSYRKSKHDGFNKLDASVHGSYCHAVPFWLKWFTMGIEFHSFHHFDTAIPGYQLQYFYEKTHEESKKKEELLKYEVKNTSKTFDSRLSEVDVIDYHDIWNCMFNMVYDEVAGRYITWSECVKQIYF